MPTERTPDRGLPIQEVSTLLGVPAPTLRSWERRYAVTTAERSPGGHRRYSTEDVRLLRLFRDEMARGRRAEHASRIVREMAGRSDEQLRIDVLLAASDAMQPDGVGAVLEAAHRDLGLAATVDQVLLPAMRQIGAWWGSGRCDEAQEHLTTEAVRRWLARVTAFAPAPTALRSVLLACGPQDQHSLGAESLGALLAEARVACRLLGARTPVSALVTAVEKIDPAAVVVVSHLSSQRRSAIEALRAVEGPGRSLFYAGNAFALPASRRAVPGAHLGGSLAQAAQTVRAAVATGSH